MSVEIPDLVGAVKAKYDPMLTDLSTNVTVKYAETDIKMDGHDMIWDRAALFATMVKPVMVRSMYLAITHTYEDFCRGLEAQDSDQIVEYLFFLQYSKQHGITPSAMVRKASYGEIRPGRVEPSMVEDDVLPYIPPGQTIGGFHTHPPAVEVLTPSICHEVAPNNFVGDLSAFSQQRVLRIEDIESGKRSQFGSKAIEIIAQARLDISGLDFLFITESARISSLTTSESLELLLKEENCFDGCQKGSEVEEVLGRLGFKSSYVSIPMELAYQYPPFTKADYYRACERLLY